MKTGFHLDLEEFISMHTMKDQSFECTGEYYTLHNYDLDSYDRRFAVIDCRMGNWCSKEKETGNYFSRSAWRAFFERC